MRLDDYYILLSKFDWNYVDSNFVADGYKMHKTLRNIAKSTSRHMELYLMFLDWACGAVEKRPTIAELNAKLKEQYLN